MSTYKHTCMFSFGTATFNGRHAYTSINNIPDNQMGMILANALHILHIYLLDVQMLVDVANHNAFLAPLDLLRSD